MKEYEQKIHNIINNAEEDVIFQAHQAYKQGYEDGKELLVNTYVMGKGGGILEAIKKAEYNRGLNEAWEAAKKIHDGQISYEVFGLDKIGNGLSYASPLNWGETITAQEVIAKIKKYEDKQKQKQDDWRDIPSDEMTLDQARRAVKQLRAEVVGKILVEGE